VDASVARTAGGWNALPPTAASCRDALLTILKHQLMAVMSPALEREWDKHQSKFASGWRVQMTAKRLICRVPDGTFRKVANALVKSDLTQPQKKAAQKDFHLVSSALATDQTILSSDDEAKAVFALAAAEIAQLKELIWVNPCNAAENCTQWLADGAKPERQRCLQQF
jgi:hypothetical protein